MNEINESWNMQNYRKLRNSQNAEFVTCRINIVNNKKVLYISIGLVICELLNFKNKSRVNIFSNKKYRNFMIIKLSEDSYTGYSLFDGGRIAKGNFLRFGFRYQTDDEFKLSQTIILDHDITDKMLLIDIEKMKWRK